MYHITFFYVHINNCSSRLCWYNPLCWLPGWQVTLKNLGPTLILSLGNNIEYIKWTDVRFLCLTNINVLVELINSCLTNLINQINNCNIVLYHYQGSFGQEKFEKKKIPFSSIGKFWNYVKICRKSVTVWEFLFISLIFNKIM